MLFELTLLAKEAEVETLSDALMEIDALSETVVEGIHTNIPLHRELMVDAGFVEGGTDIHYLESWMAARKR